MSTSRNHLSAWLTILLASTTPAQRTIPDQGPSYTRDVRPILSKNCFACHGPDPGARKAKLRLDRPGEVQTTKMLARITHHDPDEIMPPTSSGKTLSSAQVAILRRWIAAGAPYQKHWSFVPPKRPSLPPTSSNTQHPIDRFVRTRLASQSLTPAPRADRLTLVRRVFLDLIGLPPTPGEADAFANDSSPNAYEKVIDRLLASPHYGERWARRWLDLARYADSNGYEKDRNRSIWPYRDWVIRALNADMPYDQFTIEQIAGDMLNEPTPDQLIATGFHRNTMLNEEGGIDPLEYRYHAMTDRVATTGTVFLGLTTGCAQCHTHKFDPITHTEYFQLMAFLNNADEPDFLIPAAANQGARQSRVARANQLLSKLGDRWPDRGESQQIKFAQWLADLRRKAAPWRPLRPRKVTTNLPLLTVEGDSVVFCSGDTTKHDTYKLEFDKRDQKVAALRLEALPDSRLPAGGPGMTYYEGRKGDFFLSEFKLRANGRPLKIASASESYARNRFGSNPVSAALATDGDLQTGWSIADAVSKRHVAVFVLANPIPADTPFELEMHFGRHFGSSLGKFRISATDQARGGHALALGQPTEQLLTRSDDQLSEVDRETLRRAFLLNSPELKKAAEEIRGLRAPLQQTLTLIFRERPAHHPRPTHRHHRGEFLQPREVVVPGVPEALHSYPANAPRDRLGFARWLVSRDNPLAARVLVNRHWATLFGRGLVQTIDDFGAQGAPPTHPELLDWLAVEFMDEGWSMKKLHRLLVTSETYKQSSNIDPERLAQDPSNRLLARAARPRLEAEILRDSFLKAAGVLSARMFGPPVRPPQPQGVTEVSFGKPRWNPSTGENRVRRSIYTFAKRTAPFALFQTFDAPSGEACVAQRDVSNTALQALSLLNDPMMIEIAQALGKNLAAFARDRDDDSKSAARHALRRVLTRHPSPNEVSALTEFLARQRRRFAADPTSARRVINAADAATDNVEWAAWTSVARALFSLDEAVTRN
ncbi:MAG: PSD1 and planctomycete cytochrome C domain-containing protein [Planctomycetota bacterium]|nr:PSD1 and planctomycete cytochrome C domain-containing protein [Planctomycetota bacterium]